MTRAVGLPVEITAAHTFGGAFQVEAESRARAIAEPQGTELVRVLIDPRSGDPETASELARIQKPDRHSGRLDRRGWLVAKQLHDPFGDLLDRLGR